MIEFLFSPILLAPACELLGVKQRDYNLDSAVMADTLLKARELIGSDGIYVSRDNWVYHEALGGALTFPQNDESFSKEPILTSVKDFSRLKIPDPLNAPGMKTVLDAARRVVAAVGDEYYIQANIDCGPFSLAAILRGAQNFLMDVVTEDEVLLHEFLTFCTEVVVAYGKAMINTGVHGIQYGDSTAGLVSAKHYQKYALPYQDKSLNALANPDVDLWLHICGDSRHVLPFLNDLKFQGLELDAKVDLSEAQRQLGKKCLKGNLDTTFLLREKADTVYDGTLRMLEKCGLKTGMIASPGCGVARMTPLDNLRAMVRACEDYCSQTC